MFAAALLAAVPLFGQAGPEHPRVLFVESELECLRQHLDHPELREAWQLVRQRADSPVGPAVTRDYVFTDGPALYNGALNTDSHDILAFAFAYARTGDTRYSDRARSWFANLVDHLDVGYRSGLKFYETIFWDLMGVRLAVTMDLVWDTLDPAEQGAAAQWFDTLADSVQVLHVKDCNGGDYKANLASGNIKSWDDALFATVGHLLGDGERARYAVDDDDNFVVREGRHIAMDYRAKIRDDIVDEPTGPNSQYGVFRTVDWHRSIDDGHSYVESVGYQHDHHKALEFVHRSSLRAGLDLYHFGARSVGGDQRHHPLQPIARAGLFSTLNVPAVDNQWRTWDGSKWVYSGEDAHQSGRSCLSVAGFCDEVGAPELDLLRDRHRDLLAGGLQRSNQWYADFHVLRYAWPFLRLNQMQGPLAPTGDLHGAIQFEAAPTGDGEISIFRRHARLHRLVRTPVEVDADGAWDVRSLDEGAVWMIARSPGFASRPALSTVVAGQSTPVALSLTRGEHEVLPRSADHVARSSVGRIELRHADPHGLGLWWVIVDESGATLAADAHFSFLD